MLLTCRSQARAYIAYTVQNVTACYLPSKEQPVTLLLIAKHV